MVMQYGMSEKLGFLSYGENEDEVFLGHSVARQQNMSEDIHKLVDSEVRKIIDDSYIIAEKILKDKEEDLHTIANGLLEYETLTGDEITNLLGGVKPIRNEDSDNSDSEDLSGSVPKTGKKRDPNSNPGLQGV
tara:strand:- start:245 stop:643 length:399 start_codon:yes stop_codon:yes gene_type:complete